MQLMPSPLEGFRCPVSSVTVALRSSLQNLVVDEPRGRNTFPFSFTPGAPRPAPSPIVVTRSNADPDLPLLDNDGIGSAKAVGYGLQWHCSSHNFLLVQSQSKTISILLLTFPTNSVCCSTRVFSPSSLPPSSLPTLPRRTDI